MGKYLSEILNAIDKFLFKKMHLKISSVKCWPFCPGGDELMYDAGKYHLQFPR